MKTKQTHESYIMAIRDAVLHRVGKTDRQKLENARIVYGTGQPGNFGVTWFELWKHPDGSTADVIELCILGEQSPKQIAGTTLHEMAHVMCNHLDQEGHGANWKEACRKIGLPGATAANFRDDYDTKTGMFDEEFLAILAKIPPPEDGMPGKGKQIAGFKAGQGGCKAGQGTHGGKSRGKGSGSRNKKLECENAKCKYIVRTSAAWIEKGLPTCYCGAKFVVKEKK